MNLLDRLDWDYISNNADIEKITEFLSDYSDRWNWESLTKRFDHDFIVENLTEYYKYWKWEDVITSILTKEDRRILN